MDGFPSLIFIYYVSLLIMEVKVGEKNGQNSKSKVINQKWLTMVQCKLIQGQELDEKPQPIKCPIGALVCVGSLCLVFWGKKQIETSPI